MKQPNPLFIENRAALREVLKAPSDNFTAAVTVFAGVVAVLLAVALTVRTYVPCPLYDQWSVASDLLRGESPLHGRWLWTQHSEHRIVFARLLIWLDWKFWAARNFSLLAEILLIQAAHWCLFAFAIERSRLLPVSLRRTLEGLFAIALSHLNQAQNFTWAFQVVFVLPFFIATAALLVALLYPSLIRRAGALLFLSAAPALAAMNLAGGLLIGPAVLSIALLRRFRRRDIALIALSFGAFTAAYFTGYRSPHPSAAVGLRHPLGLLAYVCVYVGSSILPVVTGGAIVGFAALAGLTVLAVRMFRRREDVSLFEWLCLAECGFVLLTAFVTGVGRLQYGVSQALIAGRYQTPAMLFWASALSLLLVEQARRKHRNPFAHQVWMLGPLSIWIVLALLRWHLAVILADTHKLACQTWLAADRLEIPAVLLDTEEPQIENGPGLRKKLQAVRESRR